MNALKSFLGALLIQMTFQSVYGQDQQFNGNSPFQIRGQLGFSSIYYNVEGRPSNRTPFSWFLTGNPTLIVYGIDFPFSFTISEQNRTFRQPINRFGVSPQYKWATVHLGYRNLQFSQYSLGGHSVNGAGLEINPGKFRFAFMAGTLLRAVDETPTPLDNLSQSFLATPSFKRTGWSTRIGFGDQQSFTDLIVLKAKDQPESLDPIPPNLNLLPAENTVLAITSRQKILRNLRWELDIASSMFTPDQNTTGDSIGGISLFNNLGFLATPNPSSRENMALETALILQESDFRIAGRFRRIEPDYLSMGTYYIQSDIQNITIEPSVDLFQKKLNIGASLGLQKDNLKGDLTNQTNRMITSVSLTASPWNFYQLQVVQSNYDLNQKEGLQPLDEINKISQTTSEWQIMQNIVFAGNALMHQITGSFNAQKLRDRNLNTEDLYNYQTNNLNVLYNLFIISISSGIQAGYSRMNFEAGIFSSLYSGPQLGVTSQLFNRKLSVSANHTWYKQTFNENDYASFNTTRIRGQYTYQRSHRIGVSLFRNRSGSLDTLINPLEFKELKIDFSYAFIF